MLAWAQITDEYDWNLTKAPVKSCLYNKNVWTEIVPLNMPTKRVEQLLPNLVNMLLSSYGRVASIFHSLRILGNFWLPEVTRSIVPSVKVPWVLLTFLGHWEYLWLAKIMDPEIGASTWALGSHKWNIYIGNFTKKPLLSPKVPWGCLTPLGYRDYFLSSQGTESIFPHNGYLLLDKGARSIFNSFNISRVPLPLLSRWT